MKTIIAAILLIVGTACNNNKDSNTPTTDTSITSTPAQGNSGGSGVNELDTMRMDTTIHLKP